MTTRTPRTSLFAKPYGAATALLAHMGMQPNPSESNPIQANQSYAGAYFATGCSRLIQIGAMRDIHAGWAARQYARSLCGLVVLDVSQCGRVLVAWRALGCSGGRFPGAGLHHLPRGRARIVIQITRGQSPLGRDHRLVGTRRVQSLAVGSMPIIEATARDCAVVSAMCGL